MMQPSEEAELQRIIQHMVDAFNRHDAQELSEVFTVSADLVTVHGEWFKGRSAIQTGMAAAFSARAAVATLEPLEACVRFVSPDLAIAHVRNRLHGLLGEHGQTLPPHVEFSLRVFTKQSGQWCLEAMHNRRFE